MQNPLRRLMQLAGAALLLVTLNAAAQAAPQVKIVTSMGDITLELNADKAPQTVANFLKYVEDKHYDGTIFHRVIKDFMIQGGGFTQQMEQKPTQPPVKNEASNGLKNERGSIAMARTGDPHSATAQFFINTVNNSFLDYPGQDGWGYCVFGKVIAGMDVVDKIRAVATTNAGPYQNVPAQAIIIKSVQLLPAAKK
ncbi:peptidylprolyl isomerase [Uliginosibacterium sp. 31-16]|uniref:peptidylprolyl isomerase n=1 Tax=Uliginosibacterium sp. 31-16 TaxID=3068315 RepID=UPI00353246CA